MLEFVLLKLLYFFYMLDPVRDELRVYFFD
jgi:hypothetical protein